MDEVDVLRTIGRLADRMTRVSPRLTTTFNADAENDMGEHPRTLLLDGACVSRGQTFRNIAMTTFMQGVPNALNDAFSFFVAPLKEEVPEAFAVGVAFMQELDPDELDFSDEGYKKVWSAYYAAQTVC